MSNEQLKHMVDRFLQWKLPENFNPDGGISFKKTFNENAPWGPMKSEPVGTNLFDAVQAEAMVRYMVNGLPTELGEPGAEPQPTCTMCGHARDRHEIEPPYPCYDCECEQFSFIRAAAPAPAAQLESEWVNMACDGSIETSEGVIPNTLRRAVDVYLRSRIARLSAELEQVTRERDMETEAFENLHKHCEKIEAELEQVRKALKQFEHIEDEPVSATAEVAAESYSFLENDRDSLRRELEQVKAERDQLNTNADTLERRMVEAETLIRGLMLRAKGWPEYTEAEQWLEAALGEKGQQ